MHYGVYKRVVIPAPNCDGGPLSSTRDTDRDRNSTPAWQGSDVIDFLTQKGQVFLFSYDPAIRTLLAWSRNTQEIFGAGDLILAREGNLFMRHVHQDDRFRVMNELEAALAGAREYRITYRWIRPDNNECRWLHCRGAFRAQAERSSFEGFMIDISKELSSTDSKVFGADSVTGILTALSATVFTLDRDLRILRVNRNSENHTFDFGDPQFQKHVLQAGGSFLDCFVGVEQRAHFASLCEDLMRERIPQHRSRIFSRGQTFALELLPIFAAEEIDGLIGVVTNVSEEVAKEYELARLQRTEGLRLLASGMANNFNNALQSIVGEASVINNHLNNAEIVREASRIILESAKRASELTKQLFGGELLRNGDLLPTDLNLCTITALNRIDRLFSEGAKLTVAFGNPPEILARPDELVQVIEAILIGFREATSQHSAMSIRTFPVTLKTSEIAGLDPGNYARLSISHAFATSPKVVGISTREVRSSFEKAPWLPNAQTLLASFGGRLILEDLTGAATTISIFVPEKRQEMGERSPERQPGLSEAHEILVVDDDQVVLRTMQAVLADLGYGSHCAEDFQKALDLLRTHRTTIKLILLDAVMPGMDGLTLLKKIRRIAPEIRVLGFSGAPPEVTGPMLAAGAERIIRKPVDPRALKELLRGYLKLPKAA